MRAYVAVTDSEWFRFLSSKAELDEVNFWQPGGTRRFQTLDPGELFLFKLHSPQDFIVGGGVFAHSSLLPISLAWESFQEKNGTASLPEMRLLVEKHRRIPPQPSEDYQIGCVLLSSPFFLKEPRWIPIPEDWDKNIVQGKTYDLSQGYGKRIWEELQQAKEETHLDLIASLSGRDPRRGHPLEIFPRLGQGLFHLIVMDAYQRRCAVTGERTLPALEAAHIKPFAEGGPSRPENGILLRSDIHRLFDRGYVTVTPAFEFVASRKIREEFENGREYYEMNATRIYVPEELYRPGANFLKWHNENRYLG